MTKITNVAKNTSYLTLALIIQKIISFTYFMLLARNLGPGDLGIYYFAISFTTIFAIFIDIGLANVLTREVAKEEGEGERLLSNTLAIKLPLAIFTAAAVILATSLLHKSPIVQYLIYLSMACMLLDSFTATFFSFIRGRHNLKYESISSVVFQLIVIILGLAALYSGLSLLWIMSSLVAASAFNFIFSYYILEKKFGVKIRLNFDLEIAKKIIFISIPFGLYALFQRIYTYLDSVLLSILAGDIFVGLYQVAFKIIFALQFLPMAFTASLYPAMSYYWRNNREQLAISFERAINYLVIISLPITIGIICLSDKIILILKDGYSEAVLPLQITIASLLFIFINFPIGSLLNACDKQKVNTMNMGIVMFLSIILNFILIPKYQTIGASITVLVTNFIMFALGIYQVPKIIEIRYGKILWPFVKSLAAAAAMGIAVFFLKNELNIFIDVLIGGIIYFVILFLLGGFRREDISSILDSFLAKKTNAEIANQN